MGFQTLFSFGGLWRNSNMFPARVHPKSLGYTGPDIACVLAYLPGERMLDTEIIIIREFRSPCRNACGFVYGTALGLPVRAHSVTQWSHNKMQWHWAERTRRHRVPRAGERSGSVGSRASKTSMIVLLCWSSFEYVPPPVQRSNAPLCVRALRRAARR